MNLRYIYCSSAGVYLKTDYLPHFEVSLVAYDYFKSLYSVYLWYYVVNNNRQQHIHDRHFG